MLTNGQKRALHLAAREAGLDEGQRRLVQRNVGGFYSAADNTASREGFIAVMACCERAAGGCLTGCTEGYWLAEDARVNPLDRLLWRVRHEAAAMGWTDEDLGKFLHSTHMSSGLYQSVDECPAYWLRRTLQAMLAIRKRRGIYARAGG